MECEKKPVMSIKAVKNLEIMDATRIDLSIFLNIISALIGRRL